MNPKSNRNALWSSHWKESVQIRGPVQCFVTIFLLRGYWSNTPCQLSAPAYSACWQLLPLSGCRPFRSQLDCYFTNFQFVACLWIYCHVLGVAWRITMGSGFDDWIYFHFFTITVACKSSHTELFANLSLLSESRTGLSYSFDLSTLFLNWVLSLMLRPTVSRPVGQSGAYDQILIIVSPRWVLYSKTDWPTDRRS
jgi:hypothetical protein